MYDRPPETEDVCCSQIACADVVFDKKLRRRWSSCTAIIPPVAL